jgi:hypothetical protein
MTQETFERELERRADTVHGAPLSFEDVRGRAQAIRRRRRATVAGVVAAVVALVIVVPTLLAGSPAKKSEAPDPAPPTLPAHTAMLHDGRVTLPDGSTVDLDVDNADVTELGLLTDGRIVLAMQQPRGVSVYLPDGTLQARYPVQVNAITMSAADDAVAWVGEDFRIRVLASGAAEPTTMDGVPMPGETPGSIDAVLAPDHLLVGDWSTTTGEVTPAGYRKVTTAEPLRVTDVSPDGNLWTVQYADDADPQYGCSGLYDPEAERMVARNCDTSGLRFAPDGQHLLGMRGDNNMYGTVDVLDLDLTLVDRMDPAPAVVSRAAWADSSQLLVALTNWHDNQWSLVGVGLEDMSPETLDGPARGRNPETVAEYLLSE